MTHNPAAVARERSLRTPTVDVFEDAGGVVLQFELPGVPKDDIKINIENDSLRIETSADLSRPLAGEPLLSEFERVNFAREFVLSRTLDKDHIQASWSNGVLVLKVPKSPEAMPRKIVITQGQS